MSRNEATTTYAGPRTGPRDWHWRLAAAQDVQLEPGRLSALLLRHGTMSLRWYAPRGSDVQTPHDQDEVYMIASGSGWFLREGKRVAVEPGDVLFVPAGLEHRFVDFSDDFGAWVVFYGPMGGEEDADDVPPPAAE
jgi:mannose-6-phosphate isomerase-like protein (cupin superfamily)